MSDNTQQNDLGNLNEQTGIAQETYEAPSKFPRPIDPGMYTLIRDIKPESLRFKNEFGKALTAFVRFIVQGGESNGRGFRDVLFTTASQYRKTSRADDFIHASGNVVDSVALIPTKGEYKESIEQTFGPFNGRVGWQGYCAEEGKTTVKKASDFPRNEDGTLNHEMDCPSCGVKLGAQATVTAFFPIE